MKLPALTTSKRFPSNIQRKEKAYLILGSLFGAGFLGIVPATIGSAVMGAVLLFLSPWLSRPILLFVCFSLLLVGKAVAAKVAQIMNDQDPRVFVLDECLGMVLTLVFVRLTVVNTIIGFLLFRLFDTLKPFPCRHLEKVPHGWGIMLDDLVAGLYAGLALAIISMVSCG